MERDDVRLLYSRSFPFVSHVVAALLKKRFRLPWIAHFGDPFARNPLLSYRRRFMGYAAVQFEGYIIRHADAIVFVSEKTKEMYEKNYPQHLWKKFFVIPHCFEQDLFSGGETRKTERFVITHTGQFYSSRSPKSFLKAMQKVVRENPEIRGKITIQFVGGPENIFPFLRNIGLDDVVTVTLDDVVTVTRTVPYRDSLDSMKSSDVLLLIDSGVENGGVFLPSKLIDYLATGKPILGITPKEGESATVIQRLNGIVVDPGDVDGIAAAVYSLYEKYRTGRLAEHFYAKEDTEQYEASTIAKTYAKLFDEIVKRKQSGEPDSVV
ncbi:MAG: glycosyltransferase [Candidatus Latescibacteria bacterium]|nr:glycosyltransferase [Candidatus Latescibacterota bacterium]